MIGRLNHVAVAVPDLAVAVAQYRDTLGARVSAPDALPDFQSLCVGVGHFCTAPVRWLGSFMPGCSP